MIKRQTDIEREWHKFRRTDIYRDKGKTDIVIKRQTDVLIKRKTDILIKRQTDIKREREIKTKVFLCRVA